MQSFLRFCFLLSLLVGISTPAFADSCEDLKDVLRIAATDLLSDGSVGKSTVFLAETAIAQNIEACASSEDQQQIAGVLADLESGSSAE